MRCAQLSDHETQRRRLRLRARLVRVQHLAMLGELRVGVLAEARLLDQG